MVSRCVQIGVSDMAAGNLSGGRNEQLQDDVVGIAKRECAVCDCGKLGYDYLL